MNLQDQIKAIAPKGKPEIIAGVAKYLSLYADKYGVNTVPRIQAFLAQAAHETNGFDTLREYASGAAYEGRRDLGNIQPGDGKKFRGRGIFQITGRLNTLAASKHIYGDTRLIQTPELLELPENAVKSALWYWQSRNLNHYVDKGDFKELTRRINGGYNGLADREHYLARARKMIITNPLASSLSVLLVVLVIAFLFINLQNVS